MLGAVVTIFVIAYAAIAALQQRIMHVHAKDARQASATRSAAEVALGHGDLDWMKLIALPKILPCPN